MKRLAFILLLIITSCAPTTPAGQITPVGVNPVTTASASQQSMNAAADTTPTLTDDARVSAILTVTSPQKKPSGASSLSASAPAISSTVHTLIVAHRGGSALAPENTLGAFGNAIKIGVDMVECDVHLSKDGEVVVMHDPDVSRTTNGSGQIGQLTLAEIKKLDASAKFTKAGWSPQLVPTLSELLDLVKGKVGIQIEIKTTAAGDRYPGIERKVIDLVNARSMRDQVIIISLDLPTLKEVKAIDPRVKTGAVVSQDWFVARLNDPARVVGDAIAATGADYFLPTAGPVNQDIVNAVHARGLLIGVWTVNASQDMRRYAGYGVDAITTDSPDVLKTVLGR